MAGSIQMLLQRFEKSFESTFHKAHLVAGICSSPNLTQVKDLLEHAEQLTEKAKSAAAFSNSIQVLGQAGDRLAGAADSINRLVGAGAGATGDASAACEISEAVQVLNDWSLPNSRTTNQDVAKAFDKLFGSAARYMSKLPFPASTYAQLLSEIGRNSFFANMQRLLDPTNPSNPEGRQLYELERQGYQ